MSRFLNNSYWRRLQIFLAVVEAGSLTGGGRLLNLSQSAVSRQIAALEQRLKIRLFDRGPGRAVLTQDGEDFRETVKAMGNELSQAVTRIGEKMDKPQGPLKITTTTAFGSAWLSPRMRLFRTLYPDISVSLLLDDNAELELSRREADCAIRFSRPTQLNLIQLFLMRLRYRLYASQSYLEMHGMPLKASDLCEHNLIKYGTDYQDSLENIDCLPNVEMPSCASCDSALRINSANGIYIAVESGLGIGVLPSHMVEPSPDFVNVLPQFDGPTFEAFFVYPEELRNSERIHVVRDFLVSQVAQYEESVTSVENKDLDNAPYECAERMLQTETENVGAAT